MPLTPEQLAREKIDAQLAACGWVVQNYADMDFGAGRGIALREVPLDRYCPDSVTLIACMTTVPTFVPTGFGERREMSKGVRAQKVFVNRPGFRGGCLV